MIHSISFLILIFIGLRMLDGHGMITQLNGDPHKNGFGVSSSTSRSREEVQVLDVSTGCGQIDIIKSMNEAIANDQVALADLNGTLRMVWRQLSAGSDGGGPGLGFIDSSGTGIQFQVLVFNQNFGDRGEASDQAINLQIPKQMICLGGSDRKTCLGRVQNSDPEKGPFGSCFAIKSSTQA